MRINGGGRNKQKEIAGQLVLEGGKGTTVVGVNLRVDTSDLDFMG